MTSVSKRAALDIGSNTIRLYVCRVVDEHLVPVRDESEFVRLGLGVDATGLLSPGREAAAIEAISNMLTISRQEGVDHITAVATSAVRDASNGPYFVARVLRETGLEIEILSGDREANLTFLGATLGQITEDGALIVDLGGGSAEVIAADGAGIQWARSLKLGSGRLSEQFVHSDPPSHGDLAALAEHVRDTLLGVPVANPRRGIFTGGTATHLARLAPLVSESPVLDMSVLDAVLELVSQNSIAQLVREYRIKPERAQVLAPGICALRTIAKFFELQEIVVTQSGIREGVVIDALIREGCWR